MGKLGKSGKVGKSGKWGNLGKLGEWESETAGATGDRRRYNPPGRAQRAQRGVLGALRQLATVLSQDEAVMDDLQLSSDMAPFNPVS